MVSGPAPAGCSFPCPPNLEAGRQDQQAASSPERLSPDHLLARRLLWPRRVPRECRSPQNKRRLSLISNGRYEDSLPGCQRSRPAGPQPACTPSQGAGPAARPEEAEAIELAVVKAAAAGAGAPTTTARPCAPARGGSHGTSSRPCQSWTGSRHDSRCPGCSRPSPAPQAFGVDSRLCLRLPATPQETGEDVQR